MSTMRFDHLEKSSLSLGSILVTHFFAFDDLILSVIFLTADRDNIYLCGNSLGLQPKRAREYIMKHLDEWSGNNLPAFLL